MPKVRVGFGLGTHTGAAADPQAFGALCDDLDRLGFDSLWLSERVNGSAPDPLVAMSYVAGRTAHLKFGTSVLVLPGRNPVLLAKALASLDVLSGGRVLPAVGLGAVDPREQAAFGVDRAERGARFDEMIELMRRCWTGDEVTFAGTHYAVEGVRVQPTPVQQPLDLWLGGRARSELRRCGRLGDGWLPSFCDAADVAAGIPVVREAATEAGRTMDPEHWGALVAYAKAPLPDAVVAAIEARQPDKRAADLIPIGYDALRARLVELVDAGASKFVVVPVDEPTTWRAELEGLAETVLPLQTR